MNKSLLFIMVLYIMPTLAKGEVKGHDLTLAEYNSIEIALARGDESALPTCLNGSCSLDMVHLLNAAAFRIKWNLPDSLQEARRCADLASVNHDFTRYTCARLVNSDATNLYGYYGYWSTVDVLADAIRQGYENHAWTKLWGIHDSASSNPVIQSADKLKKYYFEKEIIQHDNAIASIPLLGDGSAKKYTDDGSGHLIIRPILNYPSARVSINGKHLVMLIDSGTQSTTLHASTAKKLGITALDSLDGGTTGITGVNYRDKIGVANYLKFANITIKNKIVRISNDETHAVEDGIIGLDILDKFPAFMLTKRTLLINPTVPSLCNTDFTVSSNLYAVVYGIAATGSRFNGLPVVAVLDTGNAAADIAPTPGLVKRYHLPVTDRFRSLSSGLNGLHELDSGYIKGTLKYLGKEYSEPMSIGANYSNANIDFNIGMPHFYGSNLYISFKDMRMCIFK